ncbi:hypothetical protein KAI46_10415, partial [bacterium]|nr:hypothetical protein [bacterium]
LRCERSEEALLGCEPRLWERSNVRHHLLWLYGGNLNNYAISNVKFSPGYAGFFKFSLKLNGGRRCVLDYCAV